MTSLGALGPGLVDAHQHFVDLERFQYYWMPHLPPAMHRSFGPPALQEELAKAGVSFTVAVQAHPSTEESLRLVELAARFPFIRGVVASVDLADPGLPEVLRRYRELPLVKAVRHQQAEDGGPAHFLQPATLRGLEAVERSGLGYDFLCRAPQLPSAAEVARRVPGLRIVLEHAGKPAIGAGGYDEWAGALEALGPHPNVSCKLSELITQADWSSWTADALRPYLAQAVRVFGWRRLLWGSGWPICLLASSYRQTLEATLDGLPGASPADLALVFRDNAVSWYGLDVS